MNPKFERFIITIALLLTILASYFTFHTIGYKSSKLNKAKQYISEFKIAKALEILNQVKAKGSKDDELDSLILYALIKAKRFEEANKHIQVLKQMPKKLEENILEMINLTNINNQLDLLSGIIDRSLELELKEDFFIKLSQERNSLNTEMQVLEKGYGYLNKLREKKSNKANQISSSKIEAFILERCLDNSEVFMGSGDFNSALLYLNKAKNLSILKTSPLKDDYYYNLAMVNKTLGNSEEAWNNMEISAKLGNERAKSMINAASENYQPQEAE